MNAGEDMRQILNEVTERIRERSAPTRKAYLARVDAMIKRPKGQDRMGCANVAHAFAAMPANDKLRVVARGSRGFFSISSEVHSEICERFQGGAAELCIPVHSYE